MTYNFLNLTNSIDLMANSIALRKPDGSIVDITNLFATKEQLNNTTISGNLNLANYPTRTDLSNTLINYPTNTNLTNSISGFITNTALTSTLSNYATLSYINNFTTDQRLNGTTTISGTLVMPNITITPTTSTKTIINSTASNGSIDFNINGIKYLGINDTTGTVSITSNFLTALGTTTLSGLITTGSITTPAITLNGTSLASTLDTFLTNASLATYAPLASPTFTGSISTPAITLNGTSLASTLALKAPLTNPTFTGLSTNTLTATGAATISGITTHNSNVVLTGTNAWLGIGTSSPQKQIEVNNPSGANVSIKSYCGNGDNTLDMQSGSFGRFLIKVGSNGVVNLYANNASSTNYGLNLNLSTSINGLAFDTSGNATFYKNIYTSSLVSAGAALFQNNLIVMGGATSYFIGGPAGAYKTIFDTTGRFGIGTDFSTGITTPATPLHVVGDNSTTEGTCQFSSRKTGCTQSSFIHYGNTADWYIRSGSTSGSARVVLQDTGGVIQAGPGTPNTTDILQVFGATTLNGNLTTTGNTTMATPPALSYTSVPTIGSSQIGYNISSGIVIGGTLTTTVANLCSITVNQGVYLIIGTLTVNGWLAGTGNGTAMTIFVGSSQHNNAPAVYGVNSSFSYSTTTQQFVATCTSSQNISLRASVNNNSSTIINSTIQAVRIA